MSELKISWNIFHQCKSCFWLENKIEIAPHRLSATQIIIMYTNRAKNLEGLFIMLYACITAHFISSHPFVWKRTVIAKLKHHCQYKTLLNAWICTHITDVPLYHHLVKPIIRQQIYICKGAKKLKWNYQNQREQQFWVKYFTKCLNNFSTLFWFVEIYEFCQLTEQMSFTHLKIGLVKKM